MREQKNTKIEKRFLENLFSFLQKNTHTDDGFVLAVSGGSDSMVLLDLFLSLRDFHPIQFCVANIDHKIRKESTYEQQWLKAFCKKMEVDFYSEEVDIKAIKNSLGAKMSLEELARKERHRILKKIKGNYQAKWVVSAHHKDDLLETFFLRLFRGTGLNGINTLNEVEGYFLRPLLNVFKNEILAYATAKDLVFFEDQTNEDTRFLRNKIRHKVIPFLEKEFGNDIKRVLVRDVENLKNADRVLCERIREDLQSAVFMSDSVTLNQGYLTGKSQAYLHEFLIRLYQKWNGTPGGLTGKKLSSICDRLLKSGDFEITITQDIRFLRSNEAIGFDRREGCLQAPQRDVMVLGTGFKKKLEKKNVIIVDLSGYGLGKSAKFFLQSNCFEKPLYKNENTHIAMLDFDTLQFPLLIRFWQEGDRIKPLGMTSYKRISRLMTDHGIKKYQKRTQLIMENGKHDIIWCMGLRISEDYKISPNTVRCLQIIYNESNNKDIEGRERFIPQRFVRDEEK